MTTINAEGLHFQELCRRIKDAGGRVTVKNCMGQRYICSGVSGIDLTINGVPGNALGAYFDGGTITVHGNAQEATGDTMNDGEIVIHGSSGDATGYAMRGGRIFVRDNTGYRTGIHMKEYKDKVPLLVIGGCAGNFLGEYQAGGRILVLGIGGDGSAPVGDFCGTGMHGGEIWLRCDKPPNNLPAQVAATRAEKKDLKAIDGDIAAFCRLFGHNKKEVLDSSFYVLRPNRANPYKRLYTPN